MLLILGVFGNDPKDQSKTRSMHHRKPDSNKRHIQHPSLRSWTLHERKTHHYSFIIARWCWSPHPKLFSSRESACQHATSTNQQPSTLSRQWLFAQQLATHFWKSLMKDFISTILPRQRWTKKTPPINKEKLSGFFKIWCHEDSGQLDDYRKQTNRWWPDPFTPSK